MFTTRLWSGSIPNCMSSCSRRPRLRVAAIFSLYIAQTITSINFARLLIYATAHFTIRYRLFRLRCWYKRHLSSFMAGNWKVLRRDELSLRSLMKKHYASKDTDSIDTRIVKRTRSQSCIIQQRTWEDEIKTIVYCLHVVNRTQIKN